MKKSSAHMMASMWHAFTNILDPNDDGNEKLTFGFKFKWSLVCCGTRSIPLNCESDEHICPSNHLIAHMNFKDLIKVLASPKIMNNSLRYVLALLLARGNCWLHDNTTHTQAGTMTKIDQTIRCASVQCLRVQWAADITCGSQNAIKGICLNEANEMIVIVIRNNIFELRMTPPLNTHAFRVFDKRVVYFRKCNDIKFIQWQCAPIVYGRKRVQPNAVHHFAALYSAH